MRQKLVSIGDDFFIENEAGQKVFYVDGKVLRVRDLIVFKDIQGNKLSRSRKVAHVSKKWFRVRDTYGVEVSPGQEDVVILAITIALDNMAHPSR